MDPEVKERLLDLERHHRVRPLLVRRHGGRAAGPPMLFAAYVHADRPWVRSGALDDVRDLLDLDLAGVGSGRPPGLETYEDPLFLVCTHGRHDACCAERGRPLAAAMAQVAPSHTWEVSHIGGDRFAANVLVLPHGLYYGRLEPRDAAGFVDAHLAGRLDVEHLRGRSSYPFSVQAAEIYLRRRLGLDDIAPLPLVEHVRHATETRAVFVVGEARWEVRVHTEVGEPRQLTCRAPAPSTGFTHALLGITEV
jgi:(2Fe-2S) ferredoxin